MSFASRSTVVQNSIWSRNSRRIVPDQAFPERMRERDLGNCLDLGHSEHSKMGWPWMEPVPRIMIRAEVSGQGSPAQCSREHPAQRYGVDDAGVDAKAKDAASELIHHDQHPMSSQRCRLASEQVATPQAVFGVAQESEPGRPAVGFWPVVHAQDTANDILVNFNSESQCDLLRDPRTAPTRIPPFHLHNRVNQLLRGPPSGRGDTSALAKRAADTSAL